jgi:hypothetical protein
MWHIWETREVHRGFWRRNLKERDYLKNIGVDGKIILKRNSKNWDREAWKGLICLTIGTGGGRL